MKVKAILFVLLPLLQTFIVYGQDFLHEQGDFQTPSLISDNENHGNDGIVNKDPQSVEADGVYVPVEDKNVMVVPDLRSELTFNQEFAPAEVFHSEDVEANDYAHSTESMPETSEEAQLTLLSTLVEETLPEVHGHVIAESGNESVESEGLLAVTDSNQDLHQSVEGEEVLELIFEYSGGNDEAIPAMESTPQVDNHLSELNEKEDMAIDNREIIEQDEVQRVDPVVNPVFVEEMPFEMEDPDNQSDEESEIVVAMESMELSTDYAVEAFESPDDQNSPDDVPEPERIETEEHIGDLYSEEHQPVVVASTVELVAESDAVLPVAEMTSVEESEKPADPITAPREQIETVQHNDESVEGSLEKNDIGMSSESEVSVGGEVLADAIVNNRPTETEESTDRLELHLNPPPPEDVSSIALQMFMKQIETLKSHNSQLSLDVERLKQELALQVEANKEIHCKCADCAELLVTEQTKYQLVADQQLQQCTESLSNVTLRLAGTEKNLSSIDVKLRLAKNEVTMSRLTIENCQLTKEMVQMDCNENKTALEVELVALRKENKALHANKGACAASGGSASSGSRSFFGFDRTASVPDSSTSISSTAAKTAATSTNSAAPISSSSGGSLFEAPPKAATGTSAGKFEDKIESGDGSQLKGVFEQVQASLKRFLLAYLLPGVSKLVQLRIKLAKTVLGGVWLGFSSVWAAALVPVYESAIQPLYVTQMLPFYTAQLAPTVNATVAAVVTYYTTNGWDAFYSDEVEPYVEDVVLTVHYVAYFSVKLVTSEDLLGSLMKLGLDLNAKISELVRYLHGIPSVRSVLGSPSTVYLVLMVLILVGVTSLLYYFRRIVKSLVALSLLLLLLPLLLVLLVLAKLWALIAPGTQKSQSQKKSSHGGKKKHQSSAGGPPAAGAVSGPIVTMTEEVRPQRFPEQRSHGFEESVGVSGSVGVTSSGSLYEPREPVYSQQQQPLAQQYPYQQPPVPQPMHQPVAQASQAQPQMQNQYEYEQQQQFPPQRPTAETYTYGAPFSPSGPPPATNRSLPSPFASRTNSSRNNVSSSASVGSLHSQYQAPPAQVQQSPLPASNGGALPEGPPPTGGYNNYPSSVSPVNSGYMVTDEDLDLA